MTAHGQCNVCIVMYGKGQLYFCGEIAISEKFILLLSVSCFNLPLNTYFFSSLCPQILQRSGNWIHSSQPICTPPNGPMNTTALTGNASRSIWRGGGTWTTDSTLSSCLQSKRLHKVKLLLINVLMFLTAVYGWIILEVLVDVRPFIYNKWCVWKRAALLFVKINISRHRRTCSVTRSSISAVKMSVSQNTKRAAHPVRYKTLNYSFC